MLKTAARNAIAKLSTGGIGTYYDKPGSFFSRLEWKLREHGFHPEGGADWFHPTIHTTEGRGLIPVTLLGMDTPLFSVAYTWFRMESGRYEFVCYPTC